MATIDSVEVAHVCIHRTYDTVVKDVVAILLFLYIPQKDTPFFVFKM
jgi:hypothetical protein